MSTLFHRLSYKSTRRAAIAWSAAALLAISAVVLFGPRLAGAGLGTTELAAPLPAPVVSAESAGDLVPEASAALEQLEQLTIDEPEKANTYDRDLFGQRWADVDRNGCDTRNDMLARDLIDIVTKPGTNGCVVLYGILHDAYTGETVIFERRSEGFQPVQADHLVPLAYAWSQGAHEWTPELRQQFANDPANLQITTVNQAKGDSGPTEWTAPDESYRCTYAARFVFVLTAYGLTIPVADHNTLTAQLASCTAGRIEE
ncbi:HNH endonuclease family protein [Micromonospora sp. DT81.3]|uniref:HNH endonuclease family protein n=1 Tax=Micromonospora sp. DT81.3 TaxID=3416523 RepID=UPI003CF18395